RVQPLVLAAQRDTRPFVLNAARDHHAAIGAFRLEALRARSLEWKGSRELRIEIADAAEHAEPRERRDGKDSQRLQLRLDADGQPHDGGRHGIGVNEEELLLEVAAAPEARLDRVVAVELISADDAVDAGSVRDPRTEVLALFLVVEVARAEP